MLPLDPPTPEEFPPDDVERTEQVFAYTPPDDAPVPDEPPPEGEPPPEEPADVAPAVEPVVEPTVEAGEAVEPVPTLGGPPPTAAELAEPDRCSRRALSHHQ